MSKKKLGFYVPNHELRALAVATLEARAAAVRAGAHDEMLDRLGLLVEDRGGDIASTGKDLLQAIRERGEAARAASGIISDVANAHLNSAAARQRRTEAGRLVEKANRLEREACKAAEVYAAKRAALVKSGLADDEILRAIGSPPADPGLEAAIRDLRLDAGRIEIEISLAAREAGYEAAEEQLRLAGLVE